MLAKNERKEKDTHPDYQGSCEVNGVPMWISGWTKTGKEGSKMAGKKFMSLSFKPKDEKQAKPTTTASAPKPAPVQENLDEDVPF